MSEPIIQVDYELHFANGVKEYLALREGRDKATRTEDRLVLEIQHEDGAIEQVEVFLRELACLRIARRELPPEVRQDEASIAGAVTH